MKSQVAALGLERHVHFLGPVDPDQLHGPLSAADLFVLASSYEGWANVLLEAMACGIPVVATDVGGNGQVVSDAKLGRIVPLDDPAALESAIGWALDQSWDRDAIRAVAEANSWDSRIPVLLEAFDRFLSQRLAAWRFPRATRPQRRAMLASVAQAVLARTAPEAATAGCRSSFTTAYCHA